MKKTSQSGISGVIIIISLIYFVPKIGPYGALNFVGLFSALGFYGGYKMVKTGKASLEWPMTDGTITVSEVSKSTSSNNNGYSYKFRVEYEYEVEGQHYTGTTYSYKITTNSANSRDAEALVKAHPIGSVVNVYSDPRKPSECVLVPGVNMFSYLGFLVGGVFLLAMIGIILQNG